MDYILVSDDCHECHYISNAFTLLRLPLKKLSIDDLKPRSLSNSLAMFVCKTIENQYTKQIIDIVKNNKIGLISLNKAHHHETIPTPIHVLPMPFSNVELKTTLAHYTARDEEDVDTHDPVLEKIVGEHKTIRKIKSMIKQVADSDTTVLIQGQSGTGKDIIASCIHQYSARKINAFVPINCGAIPNELIESELFGHEKGAFTGASSRRAGRFEMANNGTLFLDEIGDMPLHMQVKLLRVIQDRKVEHLGGNLSIDVNVRLIAATHKNLEEMIQQNQFRDDLYYRLSVFPIYVPSLAERSEDIPLLADYFLEKFYKRLKHRVQFTPEAMETLCQYPWPGNIRELQNFLERMIILYPDKVVDKKHIDLQ